MKKIKKLISFILSVIMALQAMNLSAVWADVKIDGATDEVVSGIAVDVDENNGNDIEYSEEFLEESNKEMLETVKNNAVLFSRAVASDKQVDLVFVLDTTGSMGDVISNVKLNIAEFAKYIEKQGVKLRISLIEYKDITIESEKDSVIIHEYNHSKWYTSTSDLVSILSNMNVNGGGDVYETAVDALGYLVDNESVLWSSGAYKFAFLFTDDGTKIDNVHGYESVGELADDLNKANIVTSVVTGTDKYEQYTEIVDKTGGTFADINSSSFNEVLVNLADEIINEVRKDEELTLKVVDLDGNVISKADVNIYNGTELYRTEKTGDDGYVVLDTSDIPKSQYSNFSVSAKYEVISGDAIDGSDRNKLFDLYEKNEDGENIRYRYELHSETIDQNGNWCGVSLDKIKNNSELIVKEPRMLVSLSVAYLAADEETRSEDYYNAIKNMMNNVAKNVAQTTDGHILIDKVYILNTDNRNDFYVYNSDHVNGFHFDENGVGYIDNPSNISMADIRIETIKNISEEEKITSNAQIGGFFLDDVSLNNKLSDTSDSETIMKSGKLKFYRVQMSGTEGGNWNYTPYQSEYAESITHELGHYLMCLYDEYLRSDDKNWDSILFGFTPPNKFGLMDNQHEDIEMSKNIIDYRYLGDKKYTDLEYGTAQSYRRGGSCENTLIQLLLSGEASYTDEAKAEGYEDKKLFSIGDLKAMYTPVLFTYDRRAEYPYAELSDEDFVDLRSRISGVSGSLGGRTTFLLTDEDISASNVQLANIAYSNSKLEIKPIYEGNVEVYERKTDKSEFEKIPVIEENGKYYADLELNSGSSTEIRVVIDNGTVRTGNYYYIEKSFETEDGYIFTDINNTVMAYVVPESVNQYNFITQNFEYQNGEYKSVNQALEINSTNKVGFNGEIYSVASINDNIDFSSVSWFKYADGEWTKIDTDLSNEENMNIGARADLQGEGIYVLMAKAASNVKLNAVTNIEYRTSNDRDGVIYVSFNDSNDSNNIDYYNIYYSDINFENITDSGVNCKKVYAGDDEYLLNLRDRNKTAYVAVEVIGKDGSKSDLSNIISVKTGEADRDNDGIPDWWCDKYLLWGEYDKDIANSDDDGDGYTNLEEYNLNSNPKDSNSPDNNEIISVEGIKIKITSDVLTVGNSTTAVAEVIPSNSTNKNVNWYVSDNSIAKISSDGNNCLVTGLTAGDVVLTAVSSDGGYVDSVNIKVTETTTKPKNYGGGGAGSSSLKVINYNETGSEETTEITTEATTEDENKGTDFTQVKVTIGSNIITINDKEYEMEAAPYIQAESNSTLVPLRFVAIALLKDDVDNADNSSVISWDPESKSANVYYKGKTIQFHADSDTMIIAKGVMVENIKKMDNGVKAEIKDGRMYIPFRALGEALGADVEWDAETKTAIYNINN